MSFWFAQATTYDYNYTTSTGSSGLAAIYLVILLVIFIILIVTGWKIFTKAGQAGWKTLIPIYNAVVLMRIIGLSGWYVLLFLIPFVSFLFSIYVLYRLAVVFGHGIGMTIALIFYVGYFILAFGSSKYVGPSGVATSSQTTPPQNPQMPQPPSAPTPPPAEPQPPASPSGQPPQNIVQG